MQHHLFNRAGSVVGMSSLPAANNPSTETITQWLKCINRTSSVNGAAVSTITHPSMYESSDQSVGERLLEQAAKELDKLMYTLTDKNLLKAAIIDQGGK